MAVKKFDHAVIYDGKFYPADTEIEVKDPAEEAAKAEAEAKAAEEAAKAAEEAAKAEAKAEKKK